MKKLKLLFATALATLFVAFGVSPVVAYADEGVEMPENSVEMETSEEVIEETESVENEGVFEQKTYVWEEDGNKLELTLLNETTAEGKLYVYGTYSATVNFLYTYIESDVIELHFPDDSYFESYRLHPNGYLIEYDDGVYIPPDIDDSEEEEKTKLTYEDILAITGEIMEQEGFKNKWDKALFHIETAASEKNVELLIVLVLIVIILFVGYIAVKFGIWKVKHKNDTTSKDVKDIKQASGQQTTAINTLIDEEEKLTKEVHNANTEATTREKALAESIEKQNVAIRCFIRGTKIEQSLKEEAFRALNESNDCCDKAKK
jgi:cell division protein FtsB